MSQPLTKRNIEIFISVTNGSSFRSLSDKYGRSHTRISEIYQAMLKRITKQLPYMSLVNIKPISDVRANSECWILAANKLLDQFNTKVN